MTVLRLRTGRSARQRLATYHTLEGFKQLIAVGGKNGMKVGIIRLHPSDALPSSRVTGRRGLPAAAQLVRTQIRDRMS